MGGELSLCDFDYDLPQELVAQEPASHRDQSRLLVVRRDAPPGTGLEHRLFSDLPCYLRAGDCLVLNDTRVMAARLTGHKAPGGARAEVLLLSPLGGCRWRALVRRSRRFGPGTVMVLAGGELQAVVEARLGGGEVVLCVDRDDDAVRGIMDRRGDLPLPPYIHSRPRDPGRYQTVYAREAGSVAAPTAGLHFTPELLDRVRAVGASIACVTLHVGEGTFRPVREQSVTGHRMHAESYTVAVEAVEAVDRARRAGGRVVAVGTTAVRTLEAAAGNDGQVVPGSGVTDLFIYPGYRFGAVDALVTNFHLPRSTLLMLVSAFAGRERVLAAYGEAINCRYRFYSFGDAMLVV